MSQRSRTPETCHLPWDGLRWWHRPGLLPCPLLVVLVLAVFVLALSLKEAVSWCGVLGAAVIRPIFEPPSAITTSRIFAAMITAFDVRTMNDPITLAKRR